MEECDKSSTPAGTSRTTDFSSLPTDQNDVSEEDLLFGIDLLHNMDIDDIMELRKYFFPTTPCSDVPSAAALTRDEFVEAMQEVAGTMKITSAAGNLFDSLDVNSSGAVTWYLFLDGIIRRAEPTADGHLWTPIDGNVDIYSASHCKRESIVKIVALESRVAFCYAVVSRLGRVGIYDGGLQLLDGYKLALKPGEEALTKLGSENEEKRRRSQTTWIADVVDVADGNCLLYASSDRSLHLYDANCLIHIPLCRIIGLPDVPTCLEYYSGRFDGRPSLLFIGDDAGNIITMKFHRANTALFKKKHPDKMDTYYWSELSEQSDYVTYTRHAGVHRDAVSQMSYCPTNETLLSCSNDATNTLVIRHVDGRRQPYVFKVTRGIKCFHYERSMHVIATGSNDFVVRVWNEVVTRQPVISLYGHKAPIVDVRIMKYMSAIISLSREGVVKVWDVNDYYCQMTLHIQFPILKVVGAKVDFGVRSIYPGPKTTKNSSCDVHNSRDASRTLTATSRNEGDDLDAQMSTLDMGKREESQWTRRSIVVTCSNYMAVLRLTPMSCDATDGVVTSDDGTFLPPPPKEHYASAPSPWKAAEAYAKTPEGSEESGSTGKSSGSSSTIGLIAAKEVQAMTAKRVKKYRNFTSDTVKSPMKNMNAKRTQYSIKQEQMRMLVEQCAPHLALDLHDLDPIKFSKPLPVTRSMKEKGVDVSEPERVVKAKIQKEPALASLGSSSAAQSPRSSKSSKSTTALKKRLTPGTKGRATPDWFAEKIQSVRSPSSSSSTII